jgi:beta-glucosidase
VSGDLSSDGALTATFTIQNNGTRSGDEVAQLYVEPVASDVPRPPRELKGFQRITLRSEERGRVSIRLDRRAFSHWDETTHGWKMASGVYRIRVGASSRDLRLSATVTLA